jgi:Arc/MetJ-type ribon-helix-helix transcriptional regulator
MNGTVTIDPHLAAYAEQLVEAGKAPSVSAVVNDALEADRLRDQKARRLWKDAEAILHGLERLDNAMAAPVRDAEQAVRLATVIARTQLDAYDAHVAAVADAAVCAILTLDPAKWREHARDLDEPLHFVEIAGPDDA